MIKGIDVSRWQGTIDWNTVKGAVDFAMIKLGGSDDGLYPDGQGVRNANEARRVGLPHGFYFYLGGVTNTADEVKHILNLISSIGGLKPGESIALDWEEHNTVEVAYVTEIAQGLINAGMPAPLIYMSLSRVTGNDWKPLVNLNCGLWVAAWGNNDAAPQATEVPGSDEWPFWAMWQYSSTGSIPGIGGRVDLNQFNGDVTAFHKYGAGGAVSAPASSPITQPNPAPVPSGEYNVVAGDSLSVIAARFGWTWQQLWDINRDRVSDPNKIYPNMKLRVPRIGEPTPQPAARIYTVVAGDTLSGIGAKLGIDWRTLYNNNQATIGGNPNFIKPGQQLRY